MKVSTMLLNDNEDPLAFAKGMRNALPLLAAFWGTVYLIVSRLI